MYMQYYTMYRIKHELLHNVCTMYYRIYIIFKTINRMNHRTSTRSTGRLHDVYTVYTPYNRVYKVKQKKWKLSNDRVTVELGTSLCLYMICYRKFFFATFWSLFAAVYVLVSVLTAALQIRPATCICTFSIYNKFG